MPTIKILIGIPCSGKSTFAKELCETDSSWKIVSRDSLREQFYGTYPAKQDRSVETIISDIIDIQIEKLLASGFNVIIDNTNLKLSYINHFVNKFNGAADIEFECFPITLHDAIIRENSRKLRSNKSIPKTVIEKMFNQFVQLISHNKDILNSNIPMGKITTSKSFMGESNYGIFEQNKTLQKAVIFDLDGTVANFGHRSPYDATNCYDDSVIEPVANVLRMYNQNGYKIIFCSGREDCYEIPTKRFIEEKLSIGNYNLFMRKTGDNRNDGIMKREIFETNINGKFYVEAVYDDRLRVVRTWFDIGLFVFCVNQGLKEF